MTLPDGSASIWVKAARISQLDANGYPDPGMSSVATNQLVKATFTPVTTTGDDIEIKGASGDLVAYGKHGDMIRYYTVSLEFGTPDPLITQLLAGGTLLSDSGSALGAPTGLTVTGQSNLGTIPAGTVGYRCTQYNQYGESVPSADVSAPVTGSMSSAVISGLTVGAGAIGAKVYGRTVGTEQLLGSYFAGLTGQATSAASGTGTVTSLAVTALTAAIPQGFQFTISGDTNSPKIFFTTTAPAQKGTTVLLVTASQSVTTTIAAGTINPVFVDSGAITPSGILPGADTTAGPGSYTGYQAPATGSVSNPNGVSVELFSIAQLNGNQAGSLGWFRHVFPCAKNFHIMPRDFTNANLQTIFEGQAFPNPNWGSGPFGDWEFDSTKIYQFARCAGTIVPAISLLPTLELV